MDVWVVAAATSAGFIAKYLQHIVRDTNTLSGLSISSHNVSEFEGHESTLPIENSVNKKCPLRMFLRRNKIGTDVPAKEKKRLDPNSSDSVRVVDSSCTSDDYIVHHSASSKSGSLSNENIQEGDDVHTGTDDIGNGIVECSSCEMGYSRCSSRKTRSLRNKRHHLPFLVPVSAMETCFMAQLYREHAEMEEYVFTMCQSSPGSSMSTLLLSEDRWFMNIFRDEKELHEGRETVIGIPPLVSLGSSKHAVRSTHNSESNQHSWMRSSTNAVNGKKLHLNGSIDGSFLFCLGLAVGIIFASLSSKKEVNTLKEQLISKEDLVQDLQDELDLKDVLTVKELDEGNLKPEKTHEHDFNMEASSSRLRCNTLVKPIQSCAVNQGILEPLHKTESISNIAAELEAELERLEVSMNSSSLKIKLSNVAELDPEFDADFCQGELLDAAVGGKGGIIHEDSNQTYPVSAHELTIRLHELIKSQLEERVKELESSLENRQKRIRSLESERKKSCATSKTPNGSTAALAHNGETYNPMHSQCMVNGHRTPSNPRKDVYAISRVEELKVAASAAESEDGTSDYDDEFDKLLIKQIVEKNKHMTPAILTAHKLLFQLDEDQC